MSKRLLKFLDVSARTLDGVYKYCIRLYSFRVFKVAV